MMKNTKYINWKTENLWKSVKWVSWLLGVASYFIINLNDNISKLFYLIPLALLYVLGISDTILENAEKEISEIKKYVLGIVSIVSVFTLLFIIIYHFFNSERQIFAIYTIGGMVLIILLFEVLKLFSKRYQKPGNIFKYLVNNKPSMFSKDYYRIDGMLKAVGVIITILCFLLIVTFSIFTSIGKM